VEAAVVEAAVVGAAVMVEEAVGRDLAEAAGTDLAEDMEVTHFSVVVDTHLPDPLAVALVRGSAGCRGFQRVDFLVAEITAASATGVSMDAIAPFTVVASTILIGTFSVSVSRTLDIQIITTNIRITTMTRI
jgi:hypothetical protein